MIDETARESSKNQLTPTDWRLPRSKINELQQADIVLVVALCKQAHFVNVRVRINGEWREFEADWIKHLKTDPEGDHAEPERAADETTSSLQPSATDGVCDHCGLSFGRATVTTGEQK